MEIIEHHARRHRHRRTQELLCAPLPDEVRAAGLVGPRLSAYIAFLKGACHMSCTTIQTLLADVFGVHISTGQLAKITTCKVSAALAQPCEQLRAALPQHRLVHRREQLPEARFHAKLERCRDRLVRQFKSAPDRPGVRDLRQRFKLHAGQFFTFVTTPGIEPTNNRTEQAIRYIVSDREVTQGTRGHNGQRWSERIWTVLSTCRFQHRSAFQFIFEAVHAFLRGQQTPPLLPQVP